MKYKERHSYSIYSFLLNILLLQFLPASLTDMDCKIPVVNISSISLDKKEEPKEEDYRTLSRKLAQVIKLKKYVPHGYSFNFFLFFDRPGVAGAVLQTALLLSKVINGLWKYIQSTVSPLQREF